MEPGFLKIFRRIINELALLHQNNKFHGNFRNNVKVITTYSTPHSIRGSRTVSLGERKPLPDWLDEIRNGIMSDIEALQSMVKEVVTITSSATQLKLVSYETCSVTRKFTCQHSVWPSIKSRNVRCTISQVRFSLDKKGAYNLTFRLHEIRKRN